MDKRERAEKKVEEAEEALDESRREAAGRTVEDQSADGHNPHTPERQEGEVPPSD